MSCNKCIFKNNRIKKKSVCWCTKGLGTIITRGKTKGNYKYPEKCTDKQVKINVSKLNKTLDNLWSKCVRKIGKCEFCGETDNLQAHHLKSRVFYDTRWDIRNGICLCYQHHIGDGVGIHKNTIPFAMWVYYKFGKDFIDWLINTPCNRTDTISIDEKLQIKKYLEDFLNSNEKQVKRVPGGIKYDKEKRS